MWQLSIILTSKAFNSFIVDYSKAVFTIFWLPPQLCLSWSSFPFYFLHSVVMLVLVMQITEEKCDSSGKKYKWPMRGGKAKKTSGAHAHWRKQAIAHSTLDIIHTGIMTNYLCKTQKFENNKSTIILLLNSNEKHLYPFKNCTMHLGSHGMMVLEL
jgi:hypothetical protein